MFQSLHKAKSLPWIFCIIKTVCLKSNMSSFGGVEPRGKKVGLERDVKKFIFFFWKISTGWPRETNKCFFLWWTTTLFSLRKHEAFKSPCGSVCGKALTISRMRTLSLGSSLSAVIHWALTSEDRGSSAPGCPWLQNPEPTKLFVCLLSFSISCIKSKNKSVFSIFSYVLKNLTSSPCLWEWSIQLFTLYIC